MELKVPFQSSATEIQTLDSKVESSQTLTLPEAGCLSTHSEIKNFPCSEMQFIGFDCGSQRQRTNAKEANDHHKSINAKH